MNVGDIISRSAKSKGLRRLLLSAAARKVLVDQLRALLPAKAMVGPCRLRELRFKPGLKIAAYYDAFISRESPGRQYVRPIAVTWGANAHEDDHDGTDVLAKVQAEAIRRGVAAPFRQLMTEFPEPAMQVWVSPLDARFTQLVRLLDPQHVQAMLGGTRAPASDQHSRREYREYKITSIKYRPDKRHVLRYNSTDPGAGTVFAKLYILEESAHAFRREDGARAFRVPNRVADWFAEYGHNATCLRPLAYVAEDAVVLYPQVAGQPLSDYTRRPVSEAARWLRRAGEALRTLHQMPVAVVGPLGPPRDFAAEIRFVASKSNHLPALLPQVGSAIAALLDRAQELHERLPQEPSTFTHGDVKSEHFWAAPGRLTLMDFDSCHLADPALDVGSFLADWRFWCATHHQSRPEKMHESFLAGYATGVPKERLIRAHLYEALELVKCAVRRVQLFERDWASRTAWLVGCAQDLLNDLQSKLGTPLQPLSIKESRGLSCD